MVVRVLIDASDHEPVSLFLAEKRVAKLADAIAQLPDAVPVYVAPQAIMDEIAGFPMHRGILALGRRKSPGTAQALLAGLPRRAMVLVLFGIANHDNMGGLFRNAAAFGVDLVVLDSDCCDPLYRKAIRVSAGNVLRVRFAQLERGTDVLDLVEAQGFEAVALSPSGETALCDAHRSDRLALLFGAEGPGLPDPVIRRARAVRIPIEAGVDSLNVATASGIVLHHFAGKD